MKKKAVHMDDHLTLDAKINEASNAAIQFQADSDTGIQAKGLAMANSVTAVNTAKTNRKLLETQLATAVETEHTAETNLQEAYNNGVDKANEVYPNNETKYTELGLDTSKDRTHNPPDKVVGCSVVKDDNPTLVNIHYHSVTNARVYYIMETTDADNLMNPASYYPGNPQTFLNGKGGEVTPKSPDKVTWWRVYAENAAGKGQWSDPFGGFKLS